MIRLGPILGAGTCALLVAASWAWSRAQVDRLHAREEAAATVAEHARQVVALRPLRERASLGERPQQDLIARVNATMSAVRIPRNTLAGVTTESDGPIAAGISSGTSASPSGAGGGGGASVSGGGGGVRRQSMRVALRGLQPSQLGEFLEHWRRHQSLWTTTGLDLSRSTSRSQDPGVERFDVSLVLSVIYVAPMQTPAR